MSVFFLSSVLFLLLLLLMMVLALLVLVLVACSGATDRLRGSIVVPLSSLFFRCRWLVLLLALLMAGQHTS
jgi:peptidoglycan biosynthesis protein MviN/MurJ (putative lipid II flippase)